MVQIKTKSIYSIIAFFIILCVSLIFIGSSHAFSSSISYFSLIHITNSQNVSTTSPFQQMINLTINSTNSKYINQTGKYSFQNVEFFNTTSGAIIDSWLENYTAKYAIFWIKLPNGIPANTTLNDIAIGFAPNDTNLFNNKTTGEAPQLSPIYGEYDDGANVFIQYGGKSWSSFTFVGGNWTTSNGYLQQTATTGSYGGGPTALIESTNYSATGDYVLGMAFNYTTEADARVGIIAVATPTATPDTSGYRFIGQQGNDGAGFLSFLNDRIKWVVDNTYQGGVSTDYTMTITDAGGTWSGALYSGFGNEISTPLTTLSATSYTTANYEGETSGYVGISAAYYDGSTVEANPINVIWFYMRAYPPNGVMPSISFGSLQ